MPHAEPEDTPAPQFQRRTEALKEEKLHPQGAKTPLEKISPVYPFGVPSNIANIYGNSYLTAQILVQQVAYTLSDRLFTYSPETFDLDYAVKLWSENGQTNAQGKVTAVESMDARLGAANVLLGYVLSEDSTSKKNIAQSIIAPSATLALMRCAIDQLALLYSLSSPFVAHVAAVDYDLNSGKLVVDYVSAMNVVRETDAGLISSFSSYEAQHMALFATLAATALPTIHIYDGVRVARETARITDILDQPGLQAIFESISAEQDSKADNTTRISRILENLNAELGTAYNLFEYEGHPDPEAVLVVFGSIESSLATQVAASMAKGTRKVGVVAVRVYRPFSEEDFLRVLPNNVRRIAVLGQVRDQTAVYDSTVQSALFSDVVATITMSDIWSLPPPIIDVKYSREHTWSPKELAWIFEQILSMPTVSIAIPEDVLTPEAISADSFSLLFEDPSARQFSFWNRDDAPSAPAAAVIARVIARGEQNVSYSAMYDNVAIAGALHSEIRSSQKLLEAPFHVEAADVSFVGDIKLLSEYDVAAGTKSGGVIIVKASIKSEDVKKKVPAAFRRNIARKDIGLLQLDVNADTPPAVEDALVQLAVLKTANIQVSLKNLAVYNYDSESVHKATEVVDIALTRIETPKEWAELVSAEGEIEPTLQTVPQVNSFAINQEKYVQEPAPILKSWQSAAQALSFKEAYGVKNSLRPDLNVKNFTVKVRENRRLTPTSYDRNIFHIDFDLTDTDLTYDIGEALGVHAQNDTEDVREFIKSYGLNEDDLFEIPSREDLSALEVRTVFQALQQNVDIFGKPPKKFYESLAEFAVDKSEKKSLLAVCAPEGAAEFKRRAEIDNVTFADILLEHTSARPSFPDLVKIVSPMKRREYSIASSQKVNPNSVHLLIVVVNWTDGKGRGRWGQATRYLSRLSIGTEVVVSVKPSAMKLPALTTAPLIMAGLGTGLAPFRAFVQHRAWQKAQGLEIGQILLYMGSRHQRQEYLYGEEWEAYVDVGIITLLSCAFSRDQKQKIYIQDRMRETLDEIREAYLEMGGSFYLCGPTWPVSDVAAVLEEAIEIHGEMVTSGKKVDAVREMEELKENGRYVLEVY
jgi:sulfite reductase (NADPH) flavoprotein alpha-component